MATTCPICKRPLPSASEKEVAHRPFCSERCRTVDLGGWLTGAYRVSRPISEEDLDEGLSHLGALEGNDDSTRGRGH
jgi:uncharacterized protein